MRHRGLPAAFALAIVLVRPRPDGDRGTASSPTACGSSTAACRRPTSFDAPKSVSGKLAQTDPSLLNRSSSGADQRRREARLRRDRLLRGRHRRPQGHEPLRHRPVDRRQREGRVRLPRVPDEDRADGHQPGQRQDRAAPPSVRCSAWRTADSASGCRRTRSARCSGSRASSPSSVTRSHQPLAVEEPYQSIGAEAVWNQLDGSDFTGQGVVVAEPRHGHLARESDVRGQGPAEPSRQARTAVSSVSPVTRTTRRSRATTR